MKLKHASGYHALPNLILTSISFYKIKAVDKHLICNDDQARGPSKKTKKQTQYESRNHDTNNK